jgi:glycosyltransferase involved in cell wall biosynthesis
MNILLFSPIPSHPHYHGHRKRIYNLTKYLQQMGHDIHFVYFNEDPIKDCDCIAMQNEWKTFTLVPRQKQLNLRHGNYNFDEWYQEDIAQYVNKIINLFHIEVIWMYYIWQSKLLELIPKDILTVIDTHDKFTDRYKLLSSNGNKTYAWFSCSKRDEGAYLDRADVVVAIQNKESSYFKTISSSKVYTVGHIEQKHNLNKNYTKLETIGFLGAHNAVNEKAINDFLDTFYKYSRFANNMEIVIAGTVCNAIHVQHDKLTLLGLVDNLDDFYGNIDLVVNPLLFGTGLKIKSAEALAYGMPILSSAVGFEGIDSDSVYHKTANSLEMVKLIDKLYEDPVELQALARASKEIFRNYENEVFHNIDTILHLQKAKNIKEDKRVLELYRDLQMQRLASVTSRGAEYIELMKKIADICNESTLRHPFRKLKAYKKMLETYHFFRKQ